MIEVNKPMIEENKPMIGENKPRIEETSQGSRKQAHDRGKQGKACGSWPCSHDRWAWLAFVTRARSNLTGLGRHIPVSGTGGVQSPWYPLYIHIAQKAK